MKSFFFGIKLKPNLHLSYLQEDLTEADMEEILDDLKAGRAPKAGPRYDPQLFSIRNKLLFVLIVGICFGGVKSFFGVPLNI